MRIESIKNILSNRSLRFYVIYWIAYVLFFSSQRYTTAINYPKPETFWISFLINLVYLPEVIISTHFTTDFILPRFYFRNRFLAFYIIFGLILLVYPLIPYAVRMLIVEKFIFHRLENYSIANYFSAMLIFVFGMAPIAWYKIARHLREEAAFHQKVDNDRLAALLKLKETELKLLKSQLHPHFLFNTLNNLYSLSLEKSDKTPDLIIRLGDMLSYIIYDCSSEKVLLSKEVDFIKSFIELQKVRYDSCDISFEIEGEIDNQKIAPMLLHTFIDNSFKHGAEKDSGNPWIAILLAMSNGTLSFSVINSIAGSSEKAENETGIGIKNAIKRLDHMYKGRYELDIDRKEDRYSVQLTLQL